MMYLLVGFIGVILGIVGGMLISLQLLHFMIMERPEHVIELANRAIELANQSIDIKKAKGER